MELYENFNIIPFPFKELRVEFRKKHKVILALNRVMSEYFENNKEGVKLILDYLDKKINMPLYEMSNNENKELERELKNLDAAFGIIFDEINNMEWKEKRDIYIKYYSNIHNKLKLSVNQLFRDYSKRDDLKNMDFLLYNYIKLLLGLSESIIELLQNSNKGNINKNLFISNNTVLYFIVHLYSYSQDRIDEETMLNKIGELGSLVIIRRHTVSKDVENLLRASKDVSLN